MGLPPLPRGKCVWQLARPGTRSSVPLALQVSPPTPPASSRRSHLRPPLQAACRGSAPTWPPSSPLSKPSISADPCSRLGPQTTGGRNVSGEGESSCEVGRGPGPSLPANRGIRTGALVSGSPHFNSSSRRVSHGAPDSISGPRFPHPQGGTLVAAPTEGRARGAQGRALGDSAVTVGLPARDSPVLSPRRGLSGEPALGEGQAQPTGRKPGESARCSGRRLRPGPCKARVPAT